MQEQTPKRATPAVHSAIANFVLTSLWKVGSGLSVFVMYIAFTINR